MNINSIINNIKDPNVLLWLKNDISVLNGCNSVEDLMAKYYNYINTPNANSNNNTNSRKLVNGHIHASSNSIPHNEFRGNVNWYGIILTLIFSFAIGYLIAWILLKVR